MSHYFYKIEQDQDPESPREYDNLGKMCCWHRRYSLGDEQPSIDPEEYIANLIGWDDDKKEAVYQYWFGRGKGTFSELHAYAHLKLKERLHEEFDKQFLSLPLYLYDHGSISMSTGAFACPWDSGQVGFIYVPLAKAREEYGFKTLTKFWREKILGYLANEVETYDQFLTGQVYGYRVFELPEGMEAEDIADDELDQLEEVDSCWGIYGETDAQDDAKESVAWHEEHHGELMLKRQQAEFRDAGQLELDLA